MDLVRTALEMHEASDAGTAFAVLAEASRSIPGHRAVGWLEADGKTLRFGHPHPFDLPAFLHDIDADPGSGFREGPDAEALVLPLTDSEPAGLLVMVGDRGTLRDADPEQWAPVGRALAAADARDRELGRLREQCDTIRRRAEEVEALNVLGLSANRTLDPDEVVGLVARFTRTLLGADSVTVHTTAGDSLRTAARVGDAGDAVLDRDDPIAAAVVSARKPLVLPDGGRISVEYLLAQREMRAGLGVPLSLFGETFGALVVGYRRDTEVAPRDIRLALTLAGHAAVAISNARLHRAVEDRSDELERAYQELRKATGAKEAFFNAMSHELRTPISAVKGYSEILLEGIAGELSERARGYIERSRVAAETLVTLVNDLLDFAKLEAGKMELRMARCDAVEVVEDALSLNSPQAEAKGIRLRIECEAAMPALRTDRQRLQQIVVNLLSNAVKFTEEGEVCVVVECPEEEARLRIHVRDTGSGIDPENLEMIFEDYAQVPGSAGTGLGLPISRKLARLMGGDLTATSELGSGSTFTLSLPLQPDPESAFARAG